MTMLLNLWRAVVRFVFPLEDPPEWVSEGAETAQIIRFPARW